MAKTVFSFQECSFTANRDEFRSMIESCESMERASLWEKTCSYGVDDWEMSKGTDCGFYEVDLMEERSIVSKYDRQIQQQDQIPQSYMNSEAFYDQGLDILSPPLDTPRLGGIPSAIKDVSGYKKGDQSAFSLASLELLKKYGNSRSNGGRIVDRISSDASSYAKFTGQKLSTEEVIRIAGARFIQSCYRVVDIASMLNNPFGLSLTDFSDEDSGNVELVELLLASAEKVGYQQFERASRLLSHCDFLSSDTGNAIQRVVYYFSKALQDRIDRETGSKDSRKEAKVCLNQNQEMPYPQAASFGCYQKVPFYQVARFTAIQAILENVAGAKRIHIIDLEIRHGAHWAALMQALRSQHDCPLELLKISAIGTSSKMLIEDTGKRLSSFAESMSVPFSFKTITVSDMMELKEDLFDQDPKEAVAIYSEYLLMRLITEPNCLEHIMKLLRRLNPCVMVVMETEANNNSPHFVNRFVEALFFYSAYFDCFDSCMDRDDPNRLVIESLFFHHGIRNIVASEGKERWVRHVKIDVWRSFFARFRMKETELSPSSLYQANLVLKQFACGSYCTLNMNEKCLLIGWKGTPISSVSVWKFI